MQTRRYIHENLKNIGIEETELRAEVNFILENFLNIKNPYIDFDLTENTKEELNKIFIKRKSGMPLQYILGVADFMGKKFFVNENVLIPRPETEFLTEKTLEKAAEFSQPVILDIGTGSGCISIMLSLKIKNAHIISCDISQKAIDIAKINSKNLGTDVKFIQSDIFSDIDNKFDIIVSNPPYIPLSEKQNIQKEVSFEPDCALYTKDEKGTEFYEKIISQGKKYLNKGGYMLFELGAGQSELVKNLFLDYNYREIETEKDFEDNERVICAKV